MHAPSLPSLYEVEGGNSGIPEYTPEIPIGRGKLEVPRLSLPGGEMDLSDMVGGDMMSLADGSPDRTNMKNRSKSLMSRW